MDNHTRNDFISGRVPDKIMIHPKYLDTASN